MGPNNTITDRAHDVPSSVTTLFFTRNAFIRDEMLSTENLGKIWDGEYTIFFFIRA